MPEWDKSAFHDQSDGMYKVPEPKVEHPDFIVDPQTDILIPKARGKSIRLVDFAFGGSMYRLEVNETADEIREMVKRARADLGYGEWFTLTDPVYSTPISVPGSAMRDVVVIIDGYKDMEAVKQQLEMAEAVKRQQAIQLLGAANPRNNGRLHRN